MVRTTVSSATYTVNTVLTMSFVFHILKLCYLGFVDIEGIAPARVSQFLERVTSSPRSMLLQCKPTHLECTHPGTSIIRLSYSRALSTCPHHPGARPLCLEPSGPTLVFFHADLSSWELELLSLDLSPYLNHNKTSAKTHT